MIPARTVIAALTLAAILGAGLRCPAGVIAYRARLGHVQLVYWPVEVRSVGPDATEYTFRARVRLGRHAADGTQAWITSVSESTAVLDGALRFDPPERGPWHPSVDTFSVRQTGGGPFDPRALTWLEMDRFGGWKAVRAPATGRFRLEVIDGVSWFITPDGHGFYCAGVTGFDPAGDFSPALGTRPYHDQILARYGTEEAWAEVAEDRFRAWNLSCVGGWTNPALFRDEIPYAVNGSFMSRAPEVPGWPPGGTGRTIRDVFDPGFPTGAATHAEGFRDCAENPFCIGVYTDNELPFGPGLFQTGTWVDAYLTLPAGAPGKLALQAFFEERYDGDLGAFNQAWDVTLGAWDDVQDLVELGMGIFRGEPPALQQDRLAFLAHAAEHYFRVAHDALRAVDSELLILGARFSPPFTAPGVVEASGPFVDVVSLNNYEIDAFLLLLLQNLASLGNLFLEGAFHDLDTVHALTGKPLMITEYFYRLQRPGVVSIPFGLPEVADETERVEAYTHYRDEMLARPFIVGTHWFQYQDQPVEGRFDGENQLIGLVDLQDDPHRPLTERMTQVNGATPLRRTVP